MAGPSLTVVKFRDILCMVNGSFWLDQIFSRWAHCRIPILQGKWLSRSDSKDTFGKTGFIHSLRAMLSSLRISKRMGKYWKLLVLDGCRNRILWEPLCIPMWEEPCKMFSELLLNDQLRVPIFPIQSNPLEFMATLHLLRFYISYQHWNSAKPGVWTWFKLYNQEFNLHLTLSDQDLLKVHPRHNTGLDLEGSHGSQVPQFFNNNYIPGLKTSRRSHLL